MLVPEPFPDGELEVYTHHPRAEYEPVPKEKPDESGKPATPPVPLKPQVDKLAAAKVLDQLRAKEELGAFSATVRGRVGLR
jgi:hypothetical protein